MGNIVGNTVNDTNTLLDLGETTPDLMPISHSGDFQDAETISLPTTEIAKDVRFIGQRQYVELLSIQRIFNREKLINAIIGAEVERVIVTNRFGNKGVLSTEVKARNVAHIRYSDERYKRDVSMSPEQAAELLIEISPDSKDGVNGMIRLREHVERLSRRQQQLKEPFHFDSNTPLKNGDVVNRYPLAKDILEILNGRIPKQQRVYKFSD
jgi:hypothetical protein